MKKMIFLIVLFPLLKQIALAEESRILKFSDDFSVDEISSLQKWDNLDPYDFFSVESGRVKVESNSDKITGGLIPKSEYWDNENGNFDLEFDYQIAYGNPSLALFLNFRDIDNYYFLALEGKHKYLRKVVNGDFVFISAIDHDQELLGVGGNYQIKIRFYLGEIFIFINDELVWRVSDFSFNPNNYGRPMLAGFNSSGLENSSIVYFDNFKYYLVPSEVDLNVPYYSQLSPWWNIEEYDHGSIWTSNNAKFPTMSRWGCAVTSMAMIFNHYKMNYLPDKTTPLDPGTLNNWLKSERDGYVGEGLVNWMALTRLSRLIHEAFYQEGGENLPKLETWATKVNPKETAFSQLHENKPVILMVPGHFMVGEGYTPDDIDMLINDPAFSTNDQLRDYEDYHKPLLSTRTFTPSFTDLSYFLVVTSEQNDLVLKNKNGEILEGVIIDESVKNLYGSLDGNEDMIKARQFYFSKPEQGEYFLEIKNQNQSDSKIDVYLYDEEAEFNDFSFSSNQDLDLKIKYEKENIAESEVVIVDDFLELESLIDELRNSKEIRKKYVYVLLKKIASLSQVTDNEGKERYWNLIIKLVNKFNQQMSDDAKDKILLKIEAIKNKYEFETFN